MQYYISTKWRRKASFSSLFAFPDDDYDDGGDNEEGEQDARQDAQERREL